MSDTVEEMLQAVYDAERNARIEWFWDAGITVTIGDEANGWGKSEGGFLTFWEAACWLHKEVIGE